MPTFQPKFAFSSILKHETVQLSEENTRATRTSSEWWGVAVVEPNLPTSTPSKIKFRVNCPSYTLIGICFKDAVEQQGLLINTNARTPFGYSVSDNTGHGTYLLSSSGRTFSHSNAADNCKENSSWRFEEGDIVSVELEPSIGRLTFSKTDQPPVVL